MTREIKFRARDKVSGKLFRVEGLNFDTQGLQTVYSAEDFGALVDGQNSGDYRRRDDEVELMQYTGLKDKNGKEIFEGDLIKDSESINPDSVYEVVYNFGGFTIKNTDSDTAKPASNDWFKVFVDKCEVVGNVWES